MHLNRNTPSLGRRGRMTPLLVFGSVSWNFLGDRPLPMCLSSSYSEHPADSISPNFSSLLLIVLFRQCWNRRKRLVKRYQWVNLILQNHSTLKVYWSTSSWLEGLRVATICSNKSSCSWWKQNSSYFVRITDCEFRWFAPVIIFLLSHHEETKQCLMEQYPSFLTIMFVPELRRAPMEWISPFHMTNLIQSM